MSRSIQSILRFRTDLSPFLVHLTRSCDDNTASDCLRTIIECKALFAGKGNMSDARFAVSQQALASRKTQKYLRAISFTETPLSEIHCLFDISDRKINLEPYGLVFLKARLKALGVSPVIYLNNSLGNQDSIVRALVSLKDNYPRVAEQILPLLAVFGKKLHPLGAPLQSGNVDFTWEREWRCPYKYDPMEFTKEEVFVGLCPDSEVKSFERLFRPVQFIDPRLNLKRYALKLIRAADRLKLTHSIV